MQANSPEDTDHATGACPIGRAGFLLGDRWVLLILRNATVGMTRFNDFRDDLGISDNILNDRLRRLVQAGVMVREPYHDGRRTRHQYRLTQAGADLAPLMRALAEWGQTHTATDLPSAPLRVLHTGCGGEVGADQTCARCGARVDRDDQGWVRPWRSSQPTPLARALNGP